MPRFLLLALTASLSLGCGSSGGDGAGGAGSEATSSTKTSATSSATGPAAAYDIVAFDDARISSDSSLPNFQHVDVPVTFERGPFASVVIEVDLRSTCYPFDTWASNPPPAGQNWPADCDAFDRNFELSFDDPTGGATSPPGIEVMRAITPFGGPEHQEIDVTDVANGLAAGAHTLRVVIPTYSDGAGQVSGSNGGWNVTAKIHVTPGAPPNNVLAVIPIFDGAQTDPDGPGELRFTVPKGTTAGRLEYRATGHGGATSSVGCIGPAEEFCTRQHTLTVDGASVSQSYLTRQDCGVNCTVTHFQDATRSFDYCLENPCGDMNSVRAPRANWCPGTLTPPLLLDPEQLHAPGDHTFAWTISKPVADGGQWRISAFYLAFGAP